VIRSQDDKPFDSSRECGKDNIMLAKLTYETTPAFFVATGKRGTQTVEVDTETLAPADRAVLIQCKEYPRDTWSLPQAPGEIREYRDTASATDVTAQYDAPLTAAQWISEASRIIAVQTTSKVEVAAAQARIDARRKPEVQAAVDTVIAHIHDLIARRLDYGIWPDGRVIFDEKHARGLGIDLTEFSSARTAYDAMVKAVRAEKDDAEKAAKAAKAEAKLSWCAEFGSDRLRRASAAGYDCGRLYAIERAAKEAPGFVLDYQNEAEWKNRACPSLAALNAEDAATKLNLGEPQVVWLTKAPVAQKVSDVEQDFDESEFEACEAVVIRGYLGALDLVKAL
jgi:hypothetical protein